jgi:hypothetical protein
MNVLWVLVVILLVLGLVGGLTVNSWIFLLLIVVLILALIGAL